MLGDKNCHFIHGGIAPGYLGLGTRHEDARYQVRRCQVINWVSQGAKRSCWKCVINPHTRGFGLDPFLRPIQAHSSLFKSLQQRSATLPLFFAQLSLKKHILFYSPIPMYTFTNYICLWSLFFLVHIDQKGLKPYIFYVDRHAPLVCHFATFFGIV